MIEKISENPGVYGPKNNILVRTFEISKIVEAEIDAQNAVDSAVSFATSGKRQLHDFILQTSRTASERAAADDGEDSNEFSDCEKREITVEDLKTIKRSLEAALDAMDPETRKNGPKYEFYDRTPPSSQLSDESFHYSQGSLQDVAEIDTLVLFLMDTVPHEALIEQAKRMFRVTEEMAEPTFPRPHNDELLSDLCAHLRSDPLILLNLVNLSLKALADEAALAAALSGSADEPPQRTSKRMKTGPTSYGCQRTTSD